MSILWGAADKRNCAVPPEQAFYFSEGARIRTLGELSLILDFISPEALSKYVNDQKNDFSSWVKDAFEEPELAERIRIQASAAGMREVIEQYCQ